MNAPILTTIIHGREVAAKLYDGSLTLAVTYANRTQAQAKVAQLGSGWAVFQWGRPFFVGRLRPDET